MTTEPLPIKNPNPCVKCKTDPSFVRHPVAQGKPMDWVMWWKCWECGFESHASDEFFHSIDIWNSNNDAEAWEESKREWEAEQKKKEFENA